jgi:hypothetical protein
MNKKLIIAPIAATLALAGIGAIANTPTPTTATAKPAPTAHTAVMTVKNCMTKTGLTDTEQRTSANYPLWRAHTADGDLIRITRFDTPHAARRAVRLATDVQAAHGGRYAVYGPLGTRLTVTPLANCLRTIKN